MNNFLDQSIDPKEQRPRPRVGVGMTRTINNNIKGYNYNGRRRNRGNRIKIATVDVEMTGLPGKEVDKEETPRISPANEEKTTKMKPDRQYSREELIELMTHPLSSVKHPCLESPQNKSLVSGKGVRWVEDRWDHRKHTDSLTDEDRSDGSLDPQKKRMNDPKAERLRKEQDVVLSPQRRSFNSGCFVNLPSQHVNSGNRRPDSPTKGDREREPSHRDVPSRRIGSGRIIRDPMWDFRVGEKEEVSSIQMNNNHDYNNYRQRDENRFERRTYERSYDKERQQSRNSRYNDRKKYDKHEPEEPEWFSGGPTSQHDTIELHGFDGPVEEKVSSAKKQNKSNKNNSKNNRKSSESSSNKNDAPSAKKTSSRKSTPEVANTRLTCTPIEEKDKEALPQQNSSKEQNQAENEPQKKSKEPGSVFDIEDFLNFDLLPPLLSMSNGCVEEGGGGTGSRFSQFFRRESPSPKRTQHLDSRQMSAHDEMLNSMINEITSTSIAIPPDGNTYFAPISPAASTVKEEITKGSSAGLLELLQRGNSSGQGRKITKKPSLKDLEACGKIHSVEELEARLRQEQGLGKPTEYGSRAPNKEEELAVFRKLMMSKQTQNNHDSKGSSSSTSGINSGYQGQQHPNQQSQMGMGQQLPQQQQQQQQQQMPIPHDLVMKLLHVQQQQRQQQEVFAKLLAPPNRLAPASQYNVPPPLPPLSPEVQMHINNAQPTKELLQRPEAQPILKSLKRGEISMVHLVDQLKRNTTMQPVYREIIASIIKLYSYQSNIGVGGNVNVSQRDASPSRLAPPASTEHLLHQMMHNQTAQQQQLRIPSPHANVFGQPPVLSPNLPQTSSNTLTIQHPRPVLQRVPSPRELVVHTQNILQNALLKKKLEEQKENFRKRQELQSGGPSSSPGNQQPNTTSPTPLAFTPTSVLRKMTAEKEGELNNKSQPHSAQDNSHQPPKEPIVHVNGPQPCDMMRPKPFPSTWGLVKPIQGRAIVKGNNNFSVPPPLVASNVDYMSMGGQFKGVQRNKISPAQQFMMGVNRNNLPHQPPPQPSRVRNVGGSGMLPQQQQQQQQQQGMTQSVQQLLLNYNYNNPQQRNMTLLKSDGQSMMRGQGGNQMPLPVTGRNYNVGVGYQEGSHPHSHELSASPVSNQLARWFSPELLAQARAGKLPDMPPISPTQNMLSVEELERLQQVVHN